MDNAWIIAFYKETDPVKRLELLKANTGDGESEKDKYRKQLWIARYGKRTPVKDEFMRCLMEMKYLQRVRQWIWEENGESRERR